MPAQTAVASQAQSIPLSIPLPLAACGRAVKPTEAGCAITSAVKALEERLQHLASSFGLQGGHYVHLGHAMKLFDAGGSCLPLRFLATSASDRRLYLEEKGLIWDPPLSQVAGAYKPFAWSAGGEDNCAEGRLRLGERLKGRGVFEGIAAPVPDYAAGPAYVSLYSVYRGEAERIVADHSPALAYAAAAFHHEAKSKIWSSGETANLTAREIDCLRLAAQGYTVAETAETLQVTPRTVEFHLKNAADKFGAPNKLRAVALAVSRGLITP